MPASRHLLTCVLCLTLANPLWAAPQQQGKRDFKARAAKIIETSNSPTDLLRVYQGYAHRVDGKWVCGVIVVWGDLDKKIDGFGQDHYANWDGSFRVHGGTLELLRKPAFDDKTHKDPGEGCGADDITSSDSTSVAWESGVVGGVDGLVFKITFDSLESSATLQAGKFTIPLEPITRNATN